MWGGSQDLPDAGPMEADLARDGPIAQAFGAKSKYGLADLVLIGMTMLGERRCCFYQESLDSTCVEATPSTL